MFYNIDMSFPTGWTSSRLTIDNSKVPGTTNLTDFPVFINDVALGTTGVGTAIWSSSQGQEINTNRFLNDANLQGYWRLESDGTDSGTNGYNLTASGTPTHVAGRFGSAADFELDNSQFYYIDSFANIDVTTSFTMSAWAKPETITNTGFVCMADSTLTERKELVMNSAGQYSFVCTGLSTTSTDNSTYKANVGGWDHVCGVYDQSNNKLKLYVNGILDKNISTSGTPNVIGNRFAIGKRGDFNQYYDGVIDDVAIFDRALSDSEVLELYQGGADIRITTDSAGTNLVDHEIVTWDTTNEKGEIWAKLGTVQATADTSFYIWYDNGTATTTSNGTAVWSNYVRVHHFENNYLDSTSNGYNLTLGTGSPDFTNVKIGQGLSFTDGDRLDSTFINTGTNVTYSFWLSKDGTISENVISLMSSLVRVSTGQVRWYPDVSIAPIDTNVTLSTAQLYKFDITQTGSSANVYLDGSAIYSGTAPTINTTDVSNYVGAYGAPPTSNLDGDFDEFRVANFAISADWIATEYNNQNDPATFILTAQDYTRAISDNLSITDVIYREADFNRENTDNLAIADTVIRTFDQSITIQDNIVIITDQVVTTAVNVITIAQDIVGIDDTIFRQVDYSRNPQDTITLDDITDRSITYNRILDNSVGITDTIFSSKFIYASVLDNISIADSVNIKSVTSDVDNPIIEFYQIDGITPTIYNITNG